MIIEINYYATTTIIIDVKTITNTSIIDFTEPEVL